MEKLVVRLSKIASKAMSNQILWYYSNRDQSFVKTLVENISKDIDSIALMPTIGRVIPTKGN